MCWHGIRNPITFDVHEKYFVSSKNIETNKQRNALVQGMRWKALLIFHKMEWISVTAVGREILEIFFPA
jgi:hypothetical protein